MLYCLNGFCCKCGQQLDIYGSTQCCKHSLPQRLPHTVLFRPRHIFAMSVFYNELMNNRNPGGLHRPWLPNFRSHSLQSSSDESLDESLKSATVVTPQTKVFSEQDSSCLARTLPPINYFGERNLLRGATRVVPKISRSESNVRKMSPGYGYSCEEGMKIKRTQKKKKVSWKDDAPNGCLTKVLESSSSSISQSARIVQKIKCFMLGKDDL